jgi:hypothetical protein
MPISTMAERGDIRPFPSPKARKAYVIFNSVPAESIAGTSKIRKAGF